MEAEIEELTEKMMEEKFIDHIFHSGKTMVDKEAWVESFNGKESLFSIDIPIGFNIRSRTK